MAKKIKPPKEKAPRLYNQMWKVVDGAVRDAFQQHPEYIPAGIYETQIRASVNKRVVGALLAYAVEAAKSRSGG